MPGFKPHQLWIYHLLTGETDNAADCMKMQFEERDVVAAVVLRLDQGLRPSPHWAEVAKKMNLPE
jgi:hypothetical protein